MMSNRYRVTVLRQNPDRPGLTRWEELGEFPTPEAARAAAGPAGRVYHEEVDGRWRELMDDVPSFVRAAETEARSILDGCGFSVQGTRYGWAARGIQRGERTSLEAEIANDVLLAGKRYRHAVAKADQQTAETALEQIAVSSARFAITEPNEMDNSRDLPAMIPVHLSSLRPNLLPEKKLTEGDQSSGEKDTLLSLQLLMSIDLEEHEHGYRATKNPIFAWRAIKSANFAQLPIPDWVRTYLHTCAHSLCGMVDRPPKDVAAAVARATGFVEGGRTGAGSRFSELRKTRWMQHALAAEFFLRQSDKEDWAFEQVAKLFGVSRSTVRRDYRKLLDFRKSGLPENEDHSG